MSGCGRGWGCRFWALVVSNEKGRRVWLVSVKSTKLTGSMWTKFVKLQQFTKEMGVIRSKIGTTTPSGMGMGDGAE